MIGLSHKIVHEGWDASKERGDVHVLEAQIGLNEGLVDNKFLELDNTLDSGKRLPAQEFHCRPRKKTRIFIVIYDTVKQKKNANDE